MPVMMQMEENHAHEYAFVLTCGAEVCLDCNDHKGLARCYCGWAYDGGNEHQQFIVEQIDDDWESDTLRGM